MRDLILDKLLLDADSALSRSKTGEARLKLLTALRFHPRRATRPWTGWLLLLTLLSAGRIEKVREVRPPA